MPYDPRIGLCLYVKNEAAHVAEWIAYHYALGVDTFIVYDNGSTDDTRLILDQCRKIYDVKIFDWPRMTKFSQLEAFDECIQNFRFELGWIGFIDIDEFIWTRGPTHIKDILSKFKTESAVVMNWAIFGSSNLSDTSSAPLTTQFIHRAPDSFAANLHYKMFVRPMHAIRVVNSHFVMVDGKMFFPDGTEFIRTHPGSSDSLCGFEIMRLNHYFVRSRRHWQEKINRGYTDGVSRTWQEFESYDKNDLFDTSADLMLQYVEAGLELLALTPIRPRSTVPDHFHALPKDDPLHRGIPLEVGDIFTMLDANTESFDPIWYLNNNDDVRSAGGDPRAHYRMHGAQEMRRASADAASGLRFPPRVPRKDSSATVELGHGLISSQRDAG